MKPFTESMKYEYNLSPADLVLDIGGYEGNWAAEINRRFNCRVLVFEPSLEHARKLFDRFGGKNPKVFVYNQAVGGRSGILNIGIQGDSTGEFAASENRQSCTVRDIGELITQVGKIAVCKINAEGAEFSILERILECGLAAMVENFQIQFHTIVPNYQARYEAICGGLDKTHNRTFYAPWCWEGWTIK